MCYTENVKKTCHSSLCANHGLNLKKLWQKGGDCLENRVEQLRKERGLNQEEFARMLKVSRQTISSIERGKYNPSLDLAFAIADFFELTIEEIFIREKGVVKD